MSGPELPAAVRRGSGGAAAAAELAMSTESLGVLLAWRLALRLRARSPARLQSNMASLLRQHQPPLLPGLYNVALAHLAPHMADGAAAAALANAGPADRPPDLSRLTHHDSADVAMEALVCCPSTLSCTPSSPS